MQILATNIYKPTFKQVRLTDDENKSASELFYLLKTSSTEVNNIEIKNSLFKIFTPHLEKEIEEKGNKSWILKDDFAQELYLYFFDTLNKIKENNISFIDFIEGINLFKPTSQDKNPETDRYFWSIKHYSTGREKADIETRNELHTLTKNALTPEINEQILKLRAEGMTYKEIASSLQVSESMIRKRLQKTIGNIQIKNNIVPLEFSAKIAKIKVHFGLEEDVETLQKKILEDGSTINYSAEELINRTETLAKLLKLETQKLVELTVKYPFIWTMLPDSIDNKLSEIAQILEISKEKIVQAFMCSPFFIKISPENIKEKVDKSSQNLNIKKEEFVSAGLKSPQLFYNNPETIEKSVNEACKIFGVSKEIFVKAALKSPRLFSSDYIKILNNLKLFAEDTNIELDKIIKIAFQKPVVLFTSAEKMKQNVSTLSKLIEVPEDKLIKAGLKCPNIFYQSPETLNTNIEKTAQKLEINKNKFTQAVLKIPTLITLSSQTISDTIENSSISFGIINEEFIKMALAHPNLFYQKAETLNENAQNLATLLGCTKGKIIECAKKSPQILSMRPETINKNVENNAMLLNVSKDIVLRAAFKNPQLFYFKPETVYEKEKIKEFYKKIKNEEYQLFSTNIQSSTIDAQYMQILCYLLKKELNLSKVEHKDLEKILENVKEITVTIPKHELSKKFIEFSQKVLPKNKVKLVLKK